MNTAANSAQHHEMMLAFERQSKVLPASLRFDREPRSFWANGNIYQDGQTNLLFLAYRLGHTEGRCVEWGANVAACIAAGNGESR